MLELLDLALQGLGLAPAVGLDRPLHPLALALQLRGRVIRLLFVQLLLQLLQFVLALLEEGADLLRVRPGGSGRVVRGLLLHLLHLHLELAVLLLEEGDLAAQRRNLDLVLRPDFPAQWRECVPARLVGDDAFRRDLRLAPSAAGPSRGNRGALRHPPRGCRPRPGLVADEGGLGHSEGDDVAVTELLPIDILLVDESSVRRPEIHQEILAVLAPDLRVLGGHAGVGDADVARGGAPDGHRVRAQLDLLVFQGPVEDA
ncbi:MAG: hypothetical protein AUI48_08825 [Chloroflexi bacterium 13_1_40CM_2_68_14]|nr:MAG: hypothetical protein AUI48_08825 [Chloroflexi bacterium 13_1_40CM_2_68_14]